MTVPARPIKPTSGTPDYAPGTDIIADEANDDIQPLYDVLAGQIDGTNINPIGAIPGTAIADAPAGIPKAKVNAGIISLDKMDVTTFSGGGLGPIAPGASASLDTGLLFASVQVLTIYLNSGLNPGVILKLFQQGTTWRIQAFNVSGVPETVAANTIKALYIDLT